MKTLIAFLSFVSFSTFANPDFICWDIQNHSFNVKDKYYDHSYKDSKPEGYGSYEYKITDKERYDEVVITATQFDDGYYYGTRYKNQDGSLYNDLK
ncbi:hypothetical protein [Enterobacter kobei]|uniref:hypothetical protein n=1 Tax=Enterobacter kobei TaxID=208224 RepID=UPI00191079F1|nr:hypothetical protein [Enterobacter kobei]